MPSHAASSATTSDELQQRKPVSILQDQLSQLVANVHPIILLSLLVFSFKSLVNDARLTLLGLAPTVAMVQAIYCIICLPRSGQATTTTRMKPGQKKKTVSKYTQDLGFKIIPAILSLTLTLFLTAPLLFITVILFGGPMVSNTVETLLLALHFALLVSPQLFYVHGLDQAAWLAIGSLQLPIDEMYGMSLGACLGAWLGAIPIPLDWDRDWQRWPVTIVAGVYGGAVVGKIVGGHVLKGTQMKIT